MDLKAVLRGYPRATQEEFDLVIHATAEELQAAIRALIEEHGRFPVTEQKHGFHVIKDNGRVLGHHVEPDGSLAVEDLGDVEHAAHICVRSLFHR